MNLDEIENISEDEIIKMYDEIINLNTDLITAGYGSEFWYAACDNRGYRGYCCKSSYGRNDRPAGTVFYDNSLDYYSPSWHCCSREGGGTFYVIKDAYTGTIDSSCGFWNRYIN